MKRSTLLTLLLPIILTACGASSPPKPAPQTLTVFAAASLTGAFTEIGAKFNEANPGITITFNFAGSQALRTQIEEGAPADIFAPANSKEMEALITEGFVTANTFRVFLTNQLVVILPADNPAALKKLEDLAIPGIKLVLAAEDVPVGKYSRQALDLMDTSFGAGYKDKVLANVVSNEDNVKQVVAKVQLGEADAGIVYISDATATPELKSIEIPIDMNVIAEYPIAPITSTKNAVLAEKFIQYILSAEGQTILATWGFVPAN